MKQLIMEMKRKFERVPLTEKARRWQDSDGDGKWYEPGEDVNEQTNTEDWTQGTSATGGPPIIRSGNPWEDYAVENAASGTDKEVMAWAKSQRYPEKHYNLNKYTRKQIQNAINQYQEENGLNVNEMSTSAGVAPVTGKYFSEKKNEVAEAMEKRYERLIEGYGQYVTENPKMSAEAKVNRTIKEAYKKLREIEEAVHNATRLKSESGMTREAFNKSAVKALTEMSNKLKTIAERVRNLNQ